MTDKMKRLNLCEKVGKKLIKGMEHVPNIFMSFDKYLFLEVINVPITLVYLNNMKYNCSKNI